ncbi:regulator of G-protein signaling 3-like isoform X2 [Mugil cephalus]|uniref:regulator of G-protein signaling 3-like isoform X2 n=1 Tax=Mugil cephalus TaxID=48193 RepID=UPI001FB6780A|nr:regulator of G-protein signaling 3-like isoform X2 [Mugil cephalus]
MFWKNVAWSWSNDDDEDGGCLLAADLRRTPDWTPEPDQTQASTGLKDVTNTSLSPDPSNSNSRLSSHVSRDLIQPLMVSIGRGRDGFGFTICSDCPVRVQDVDPRGPAHQSGLRQGDSVLQLNGLPVETWKCVDLAHAIRGCPSQIILVVWRGSPELRSGCDAWLRPPVRTARSHPSRTKSGDRIRSSLGHLGSLWRNWKKDEEDEEDEEEKEEEEVFSPHTTTLKGTRVTSSNGENYIILSAVSPEEQLLPVYRDGSGTIGRLYQTDPSRGQNIVHDPRTGSPHHTSTTFPSSPPGNYGNYQNCTIVQSHLPGSGYGTHNTLTPKSLIFPVFVQPLDLCSPDRTLLMSEEMVLHQDHLLPTQVTVLIYNDLLLLTRDDGAGSCNVLQSPLHLNALQLRDRSSEPLHIFVLRCVQSRWRFVFSLEAFSIEQKVRVSLCLHDNIQLQLVAKETRHHNQLSDLPSDFSLLSLRSSDLLYHPSSHYSSSTAPPPHFSCMPSYSFSTPPSSIVTSPPQFLTPPSPSSPTHRSPIWMEEEEEERQQGEGESASETSEIVRGPGGRGHLLSPAPLKAKEEEESDDNEEEGLMSTYRPAVLRRSLSEGSLLQEPRWLRFLSDSTIHHLTRQTSLDRPSCPPSPQTLKEQLTRAGGSLHHMMLLLSGTKGGESRNRQRKKKKRKNLAADVQSLRWNNRTSIHGNSLEKALRNSRPSVAEVLRWTESLKVLLTNGLVAFRHFLRSEFCEDNLDFWLAVERFKRTRPFSKMSSSAEKIYDEFISTTASRQVNVDSSVRELTNQSLRRGVSPASFQLAQDQVFGLMESDSYPRFLKSRLYSQLANHRPPPGTEWADPE